MERASEWVQEMRAGGAATTVRRVSVKLWDTEIRNPPLFHASYYDEEQGLSADEAYAARVHERHWMFDRGRGFTYNGLPLTFSYPEWDDLEPKPDVCPHCGRGLSKDLQRQAVERQLGRAVAI